MRGGDILEDEKQNLESRNLEAKREMKKEMMQAKRKYVFITIACIALILYGMNFYSLYEQNTNLGFSKMDAFMNAFDDSFSFRFQFSLIGLVIGLALAGGLLFTLYYKKISKVNTKEGKEYGDARKGDIIKEAYPLNALNNPDPKKRNDDANIILSDKIKLDIDTRHTMRNDNIFVIGGSGTGKTRFFVKPNILQMYCNYVVIDPKGSVAEECGKAFEENGYSVTYLNLVNMERSMGYNPFEYFHKPEDVSSFVQNLISNTSDKTKSGGDEFFTKAEIAWLTSVIFLVLALCEGTDECNMNTVMLLFENSEAKEEEGADSYKSAVDMIFEELEKEIQQLTGGKGEYTYRKLAISYYKVFKVAAGKTAKSILVSIGVRLAIFYLPSLSRIMEKDELHLERISEPMVISKDPEKAKDPRFDIDRKTYDSLNKDVKYEDLPKERLRKSILFIVISDSEQTFSFMASIILQQLYTQLYYAADNRKDKRLPIHTRFINDEFSNCGKQPDFEKKISTMRSREISTAVIVQGISQIKSKTLYGDDWETIFENCDSTLFLGSKGESSQKTISNLAGKETVTHITHTVSKGTSTSYSTGEQVMGSEMYDCGAIGRLDNSLCLVHIRGHFIYEDKKYDVMKHPRVNQTADAEDKELAEANLFDIEDYVSRYRKLEVERKEQIKNEILKSKIKDVESVRSGDWIDGKIDLLESNDEIFMPTSKFEEIVSEVQEQELMGEGDMYPESDE